MALQQIDLRPQEGFNQIYTKIINCEISNPPYNNTFSSKYFFLKKREGINQIYVNANYSFYDIINYTDINQTKQFYLGVDKTTNELIVLDELFNEQLRLGKGNVLKFIKVLGGGQSVIDSGTATGGTTNSLTDTTKTWTDNQLAGYYIFIKDGTGAGQLRQILSNTSNTINVSGWDSAPISGSQYIIYETLVDNILVPYYNGCYVYDGVSWYDAPVFSGYNIKDITVWNSRLWYAVNNQINYSEEGDLFYSPAGDELFVSDVNINNLFGFGNYLLVGTENSIGVIYKGFSTTDGSEFFILKEGVSQIGISNFCGIGLYRNNIYFVGTDNRLYSIGISIAGDTPVFDFKDQGTIPANFIREYVDSKINIYSDVNNIYLYTDKYAEIYYNDTYKGWLKNEYKKIINKKKFFDNKTYILGDGFIGIKGGYKDIDQDYGQIIEFIVGEPDIFNWKDIKYINLLLGKSDYIQNGILTVTADIANRRYSKEYNLQNTGYISDLGDVVSTEIGSNILGLSGLGGDNELIYDNYSLVELIQVGIDLPGQIITFTIDTGSDGGNGIYFGGVYVYYNTLNPKMKYYKNII